MMDRRSFLEITAATLASSAFEQTTGRMQRPLPKSEYDYVDWSWERWRQITKAERPTISTEQTGKAELRDLLKAPAVTSPAEWQSQREAIARVLNVFLGEPPRTRPALEARTVEETSEKGYTLRRLVYQSEPGEFVPAYLLVPEKLRQPMAAVICPHQTTQAGKREPAGLAGNPNLQAAMHLAQRGYVTFSYDAICFGERHDPTSGHYGDAIPFYRRHPRWSLMGKMVWDLSRAIDYLETLSFVDPARIGSIGHSHGGYTTLWAMAFDERIRAGVSNCGFDSFRIDGNTWRWSRATALLPLLGHYISNPRLSMDFYRGVPDSGVIDVPFDMHEVLALIAPRPLMLSTSEQDFVFPNGPWSVRQAFARIKPVYQIHNARDRIATQFFDGGHDFPAAVAATAYDWLDRWLKS